MSDLINRRVAIKAIADLPNCYNGFSDTYDKAYIIGVLEELPTVDAVPVRHGRWIVTGTKNIYGGMLIECSECHDMVMVQHIADEMYCRHCGARMDAERIG